MLFFSQLTTTKNVEVINVFSLVGFFGAEDPSKCQTLLWAVH